MSPDRFVPRIMPALVTGLALLAAPAMGGDVKERIAADVFGEWSITRGAGKAVCQFSLIAEAADVDRFVLKLKPGCDAQITRFGPVAWKLDRGQFVMLSAKAEAWRF